MKKMINFAELKVKIMNKIEESAITENIKKLVTLEYVRQEISDQIEIAREDGDTEIVIDGYLPKVVTDELIKRDGVTIERHYKMYMFPETIIHINDESKN